MEENIKKPIATITKPTVEAPPSRDHLNDMLIEFAPLINMHAGKLKDKLSPGMDPDDLHHAGMHGLIDAFHKYDPAKGASFPSYASQRIKGKMLDHITSGNDSNFVDNYHYKKAKQFAAQQKAKPPGSDESN